MIDNIKMNLLGPYTFAENVLKERMEVASYYNFFEGKAKLNGQFLTELNKGQSWIVNTSLDYVPTQDVRNFTKKLLTKQARFMFGKSPDVLIKAYDSKFKDDADKLRQFLDTIFEKNEFWNDTFKAFLDCTIGKRILLRVQANPDEPISFHYHTMDEFTFEVDSTNYKRLTQVIIAYMEKDSATKENKEQIWYRWKYYYEGDTVMLIYGTYNGFGEPIEEETIDTMLDEIPCRVIINGGLTGDIEGKSDLVELIDLQNAYNHTTSDFRDALRFKMFEQPVFIDADSDSLQEIKIAPNAIIDLKSDPTTEERVAQASTLSSTFNFVEGTKIFLDDVKSDMLELMDMPKPEAVKDVPSAKALKFIFFDLISRCDEKWQEWGTAIRWLIKFSIKCIETFDLYPDEWEDIWSTLEYKILIKGNYPIPEDEADKKKTAIEEVVANVRSVHSYIKEMTDNEDVEEEYNNIIKEMQEMQDAQQSTFDKAMNSELNPNKANPNLNK